MLMLQTTMMHCFEIDWILIGFVLSRDRSPFFPPFLLFDSFFFNGKKFSQSFASDIRFYTKSLLSFSKQTISAPPRGKLFFWVKIVFVSSSLFTYFSIIEWIEISNSYRARVFFYFVQSYSLLCRVKEVKLKLLQLYSYIYTYTL